MYSVILKTSNRQLPISALVLINQFIRQQKYYTENYKEVNFVKINQLFMEYTTILGNFHSRQHCQLHEIIEIFKSILVIFKRNRVIQNYDSYAKNFKKLFLCEYLFF